MLRAGLVARARLTAGLRALFTCGLRAFALGVLRRGLEAEEEARRPADGRFNRCFTLFFSRFKPASLFSCPEMPRFVNRLT